MPYPPLILPALEALRREFSPRTWPRVVTPLLGTIPARGRRTVAAALRQMGRHEAPDFSSYHQVFKRAAWSPRHVARRLLSAAIAAFVPEGVGLTFAIDEALERRRGRKVRIRGHYRDPLASSKPRSVSASGIRGIVLALVVTVPGAGPGPCRSSAGPARRPRSASSSGDATRPSPSEPVRWAPGSAAGCRWPT